MRRADAGVTLVEVLVVLVLIGVMASAVGLSLGPADRGDSLDRETDLLLARLNRASDEVLLSGVPTAFVWGPDGYHFEIPGSDGWVPHPVALLGEIHALSRAVDVGDTGYTEGRFIVTADLLPQGGAPLDLILRDGAAARVAITFDGVNATRRSPS